MGGASKFCYVCGSLTGFFIWTTSRDFPLRELMKLKEVKDKFLKNRILSDGEVVCFQCYDELKGIKS